MKKIGIVEYNRLLAWMLAEGNLLTDYHHCERVHESKHLTKWTTIHVSLSALLHPKYFKETFKNIPEFQ